MQTEAQKWADYDDAKHCLSLLISHYSALIYQTEQEQNPDAEKIAELEAAQDQLFDVQADLDLNITVDDQDEIARLISVYGPMVQALRQG